MTKTGSTGMEEVASVTEQGILLSSLEQQKSTVSSHLSGVEPILDRAEISAFYAKTTRSKKLVDTNIGLSEKELGKAQILSELFIDAINMISYQRLHANEDRQLRERKASGERVTYTFKEDIVTARKHFHEHLDSYLKIFAEESPDSQHGALAVLINDARNLILNRGLTTGNSLGYPDPLLSSLLAEHVVRNGLRASGWEKAEHSSVDADANQKTDIVVPIGKGRRFRVIPVQVKSRNGPKHIRMSVNPKIFPIRVIVPMYPHPERERFRLLPDEVRLLGREVMKHAQISLQPTS